MAFSPQVLDSISAALQADGYFVLERAFPDPLVEELREEMLTQLADFKAAGIGKGHERREEIRADLTRWWDFQSLSPAQAEFASYWKSLQEGLNERLFLGLWDLEGHSAIYPPGAFYRTHLDRFQSDSRRVVSLVAFFNPEWSPNDGGELRIEGPKGEIRVLPRAGTLVVFMSAKIPHEVLPTRRQRLSFAGWFRQRT